MSFRRYGIYYTPPPGAFADAGASWLGWDAAAGTHTPPPDLAALPIAWEEITQTPRRYGFHATIKPPFHLAPGHDVTALEQAFADHCRRHAPVTLAGLKLVPLGRFLGLVPETDSVDLDALAAASVRDLDRFRAPTTAEELAKRRANGLSPRQDRLLVEWGYPYVLEEFRFHMTLTGKLPKPARDPVTRAIGAHVLPHVPRPFCLDALSLMGEDADGRFHLIHRLPLSG